MVMSSLSCMSSLIARRNRKRLEGSNGEDNVASPVSKKPNMEVKKKAISRKQIKPALKVMSNEVVMAKIARKLPFGCLKDLRRTGTTWSRNFIPEMKKAKHQLFFGNCVKAKARGRSIQDFVNIIKSSPSNPFTDFSFYPCDEPSQRLERDHIVNFISVFGHTITTLQIYLETPSDLSTKQLRQIIYEWTPNLKELEINLAKGDLLEDTGGTSLQKALTKLKQVKVKALWIDQGSATLTQLISEVVQCTTGLECLDIFDERSNGRIIGLTLARLIENSMTPLYSLKILKISSLVIAELQNLVQLARRDKNPLRLESFSIMFGTASENEQTPRLVYNFLTTQSSTLKELRMLVDKFSVNFDQPPILSIPRMESLEKFKIDTSFETLSPFQVQFDGGLLANTFPKLRKFSYEDGGLGHIGNNVRHPGVVALAANIGQTSDYLSFLNKSPLLPSVTRLELTFTGSFVTDKDVDVKEFARIWNTWPALTALHLEWNLYKMDLDMDINVLLTGVPRGAFERLKSELETVPRSCITLALLRTMLDNFKTRPGISDLKHLREFTITINKGGPRPFNRPELTDMGGYFGIALACPLLQRVVIDYSKKGKSLVSEECHQFIKNTLGPAAEISL